MEMIGSGTKKAPEPKFGGFNIMPAMTYSRPRRTTIGPKGFTAVFGMGTGSPLWVKSPASRECIIATWGARSRYQQNSKDTSEKENNVAKRLTVSTG